MQQQQDQLTRLQDMVMQLQMQLVASQSANNQSEPVKTVTTTTSGTNTSHIWSSDVLPESDGQQSTKAVEDIELSTFTAARRFGVVDVSPDSDLNSRNQISHNSVACTDAAQQHTSENIRETDPNATTPVKNAADSDCPEPLSGRTVIQPVLSPARHSTVRRSQDASTSSEAEHNAHIKQVTVTSTESNGDSAAPEVVASGANGSRAMVEQHTEEQGSNQIGDGPKTPSREWDISSLAATPPSPPHPIWRAVALHCNDLNVSSIGMAAFDAC